MSPQLTHSSPLTGRGRRGARTAAVVAATGAAAALVAAALPLGGAAQAVGGTGRAALPSVAAASPDTDAVPVLPLPRPRDFVTEVDNPWLPFAKGSRWVYRSRGGGDTETITVKVLRRTRTIEGVSATVVRDTARDSDGTVTEDTFDWYAQDAVGNVWYLGERTRAYDGGQVDTTGSWEAGRHGAHAGVVMPAEPALGVTYRQELRAGVAEDLAQVIDLSSQVKVPFGRFAGVRITEETTPIEPHASELKLYARGVGLVQETALSPVAGRTVLVSFTGG